MSESEAGAAISVMELKAQENGSQLLLFVVRHPREFLLLIFSRSDPFQDRNLS
jgi:hypothetical protein